MLGVLLATVGQAEGAYVAPGFTPTGQRWARMYREIQQLGWEAQRNNRSNSAACYRAAACYRQMASIYRQGETTFRSAASSSREPTHVNWFRAMAISCRIGNHGKARSNSIAPVERNRHGSPSA